MKAVKFALLFICFNVYGQQDSMSLQSSFAWLERKMTYNYFDPTNQHWWVNRIQANSDGTYTIKNIAAKHPNKVLEKVYHNRTLFLYDLNPNSISVIKLEKDQGRFVKGKIIRAECFSGQKDVQVIKDGRAGSKVGFIHISIPDILEDSLGGYAEKLAEKLKETTYLSARLYNSGDAEENMESAFDTFRGKYVNEDSSAYIDFEVMDAGLVRFELRNDNKNSYGTIGYDEDRKSVYCFLSGDKSYSIDDLKFDDTQKDLLLKTEETSIHVIGRNTVYFNLKNLKGRFSRY